MIALRFGAKVVAIPWRDDFSPARNESLRHASGDWLFVLDAADQIDVENRRLLKSLFANLTDENAAWIMDTALVEAGSVFGIPLNSDFGHLDFIRFSVFRFSLRRRLDVHPLRPAPHAGSRRFCQLLQQRP